MEVTKKRISEYAVPVVHVNKNDDRIRIYSI